MELPSDARRENFRKRPARFQRKIEPTPTGKPLTELNTGADLAKKLISPRAREAATGRLWQREKKCHTNAETTDATSDPNVPVKEEQGGKKCDRRSRGGKSLE